MANLSKRTTPMMGKLSELLVSGKRFGLLEADLRPELAIQSPRGLKNFDLGVVGLGIVAALEKSGDHVLRAQSRSRSRSNPIPVKSRHCYRRFDEEDDDEDYTFVTCHGLNDKSYTKVYYDGGEIARGSINSTMKSKRKTSDSQKRNNDIFSITSTSCREDHHHSQSLFPASDFLSSCHLCKKKLHGKDIYMYRGEKAFCSSECRASQILMDERKEQCRSEAARSVVEHALTSSYSRDQIFSTGIVAI